RAPRRCSTSRHLLSFHPWNWGFLRQQLRDLADRGADAAGKRGEDGDRADRDHGEDDSVLRHRLTLLLAPMRPEKLKPLGTRHVDSPPFLFARARRPAHYKR